MLKRLAIVVVAVILTGSMSSQPNKTANHKQEPAKQSQPAVHPTDGQNKQGASQTNQAKPNSNPPAGNAPVEGSHWWAKPDWWLLIIAGLTGGVVSWQSWETRKAAEAANRGMETVKTKERAKLLLSPQTLNPVVGTIPEAKLLVTNVGESDAMIGMAISGLHISNSDNLVENGSGFYGMKIEHRLLESKETIEETVLWTKHPFARYSQDVIDGKEVIHLHGMIRFKDAFEDPWGVNFHFIWRAYGTPVWFPQLQTHKYGEWGDEDEKGEYPIPKDVKRSWWKFWAKAAPSSKRPPADPN